MEHKPKALSPATQPVAQPVPAVQKTKKSKVTLASILETGATQNSKPTESTPLVFVREGKVVALSEAEAIALSQAEARHYRASQQAMRRQPKHIQALGRKLWSLWG